MKSITEIYNEGFCTSHEVGLQDIWDAAIASVTPPAVISDETNVIAPDPVPESAPDLTPDPTPDLTSDPEPTPVPAPEQVEQPVQSEQGPTWSDAYANPGITILQDQ